MTEQSSGALQGVRATFSSADQMQDAVAKLLLSGFDRADLSLPANESVEAKVASKPASTEDDARQVRTLGSSTAGTAAALAAAGITIATGGAAAPAVAAALLAGGVAGGATFAAQSAASGMEQTDREERAASGGLILTVRTSTPGKHGDAMVVLQAAGGRHIVPIA